MEQQTVELKFEGEEVGTHTVKDATYTLYRVADGVCIVHVDEGGNASWLETNGGQGLSKEMLGTFFPQLAKELVGEPVFPHNYR